ncbi:hypothetical protein ACSSV1_000190 [Labrenzia sp. MBR-25]
MQNMDVGHYLDRLDALTFALGQMIDSAAGNSISAEGRDPYIDAAIEICGDVRQTVKIAQTKYYGQSEGK